MRRKYVHGQFHRLYRRRAKPTSKNDSPGLGKESHKVDQSSCVQEDTSRSLDQVEPRRNKT